MQTIQKLQAAFESNGKLDHKEKQARWLAGGGWKWVNWTVVGYCRFKAWHSQR
jgi:hypothetical protein